MDFSVDTDEKQIEEISEIIIDRLKVDGVRWKLNSTSLRTKTITKIRKHEGVDIVYFVLSCFRVFVIMFQDFCRKKYENN
ncbi:MAG: hypothetical protein JJV89_01620 [Desulfosarcina sp.]|nr:hypothetical protein [Desulfobacterales bacterium]